MLVTPPCGASSNIALWRAKIKPPVELVVGDLDRRGEPHWQRNAGEAFSVPGNQGGGTEKRGILSVN